MFWYVYLLYIYANVLKQYAWMIQSAVCFDKNNVFNCNISCEISCVSRVYPCGNGDYKIEVNTKSKYKCMVFILISI